MKFLVLVVSLALMTTTQQSFRAVADAVLG
jgi:hypothetical protein